MEFNWNQQPVPSSDKSHGYDSDEEVLDYDDEDDDVYTSEDDDGGGFSSQRAKKKEEPRDHLDPNSYSWSLMNYTISKLVLNNMQTFLPEVGFELSGKFVEHIMSCLKLKVLLTHLNFRIFIWNMKLCSQQPMKNWLFS